MKKAILKKSIRCVRALVLTVVLFHLTTVYSFARTAVQPIVFCSITEGLTDFANPESDITGNYKSLDIKSNIDILFKVQPDVEEIVVLTGTSGQDLVYKSIAFDEISWESNKSQIMIAFLVLALELLLILYLLYQRRKKRVGEKLLEKSNESMANIIKGTNVGTWEWNVQTGEAVFNERWAEMIGYTLAELSPTTIETWENFVHPDDLRKSKIFLARMFAGELDYYELDCRMKNKSGSWVWIRDRGKVFDFLADGKPLHMSGTHADITKYKQAEESIKENGIWYKTIFEAERDALFLVDQESGSILDANRSASILYGYPYEELLHMENKDLSAEPELTREKTHHLESLIPLRYHIDKNGRVFPVEITSSSFIKNERTVIISAIRDISNRKQKEEKIIYLSNHDLLTGLYNRRFFESELIRLDRKKNLPLSIIMGDINGLKLVNDSFGHSTGDEIIKKTSKAIHDGCRKEDIIARVGGDEFVILLPGTDSLQAEKIIAQIRKIASKVKVGMLDISISFGVATKTTTTEKVQGIYKKAEDSMYRHKLYESSRIKSKLVDMIIKTLYEKSNREMLHSKRVSEVCEAIAIAMNLEKEEANKIKVAGLLHDIGKIGVDEKILMSTRKLKEEEWIEIRKHPEVGYRILSSRDDFLEIAVSTLEHHERWDGRGYPKNLKGVEISLPARIIAVADSFDAMTRQRTCKEVLTLEEAVEEIRACSGTQFDPEIAEIFIRKVIPEMIS